MDVNVEMGSEPTDIPTEQPNETRDDLEDSAKPQATHYRPYVHFLPRYPLLSSPSANKSSPSDGGGESPSPECTVKMTPHDKNMLTGIILTRRLSRDPDLALCGAETGGGVCADTGCGAVHLNLEKELPTGWCFSVCASRCQEN